MSNPCNVTLIIEEPQPPEIIRVGTQGPPGPQQGKYKVVSTTQAIPLAQVFTVALPSEDITLTLPPISSIAPGTSTVAYVVKNTSEFNINVLPSGSDQIEFSDTFSIPPAFSGAPGPSYTFLPTSLGWLVI